MSKVLSLSVKKKKKENLLGFSCMKANKVTSKVSRTWH